MHEASLRAPGMLADFHAQCLATNVSTIVDQIESDQRMRHCQIDKHGVVKDGSPGTISRAQHEKIIRQSARW